MIIRAHGCWGPPSIVTGCLGSAWKMLGTVDALPDQSLLRVVTKVYHLHVFLNLASLNLQAILKHSSSRSSERTQFGVHGEMRTWTCCMFLNGLKSLECSNWWGEFVRSRARGHKIELNSGFVHCRRHGSKTFIWNLFCLFLRLNRKIHTKLCQNTYLVEYPWMKTVEKDVYHYIGSMNCVFKWPCLIC